MRNGAHHCSKAVGYCLLFVDRRLKALILHLWQRRASMRKAGETGMLDV